MSCRYFYLEVECRGGAADSRLAAQRALQAATQTLFGEAGAASLSADVLRVGPTAGRVLLRVPHSQLRRLRAALALAADGPRLVREAASLQALL